MSTVDPNRVILTGENPFIKISEKDGDPLSTDASFWRILFSPAGPGHALYIKSELTEDEWRIYSDNIALARWLQGSIQGMLNPATGDKAIQVIDAEFAQSGDIRDFWTESISSANDDIAMTWYDIGEPLLVHTDPKTDPKRPAGVCTILIPAAGARLTVNGVEAKGRACRATARVGRSAPPVSPFRKAGPRCANRCGRFSAAFRIPTRTARSGWLLSIGNPAARAGGRLCPRPHPSGPGFRRSRAACPRISRPSRSTSPGAAKRLARRQGRIHLRDLSEARPGADGLSRPYRHGLQCPSGGILGHVARGGGDSADPPAGDQRCGPVRFGAALATIGSACRKQPSLRQSAGRLRLSARGPCRFRRSHRR